MGGGKRALTTNEYAHLETDDTGALFWKGKKVRLGGWSVGERITLIAAVGTLLGVAISGVANYSAIKQLVSQAVSRNSQQSETKAPKESPKSAGDPAPADRK